MATRAIRSTSCGAVIEPSTSDRSYGPRIRSLDASGKWAKPIVTEIAAAGPFHDAEEYHQDFYLKSGDRYEAYEAGSGREEFKERVWQEIQESS